MIRENRTDRYKSQEQEICKMNLNILPFQKARKLSKIIEIMSKEFMNHLEVDPTVQRWVICSTNKRNNISGFGWTKSVKNPGFAMIILKKLMMTFGGCWENPCIILNTRKQRERIIQITYFSSKKCTSAYWKSWWERNSPYRNIPASI